MKNIHFFLGVYYFNRSRIPVFAVDGPPSTCAHRSASRTKTTIPLRKQAMIKHAYIPAIFLVTLVAAVAAISFDHSQFDQILKAYADDQGLVDYNGIAGDARFQNYMQR